MAVEIKIPTKNGLRLYTKGKFIEEDIDVTLDSSLIPQGTITITENGEYDVSNYETANVNTPVPQGTLEVTENGEHDVTNYEKVNVNVESIGDTETLIGLVEGRFERLEIPYGTTRIKGYLFEHTDGIYDTKCTYISIPNTVTEVKNNAFNYRSFPPEREIYFQGTLEEWCSISFDSSNGAPFYESNSTINFYVNDKNGNKVLTDIFVLDESSSIEEIKKYVMIYHPLSKIDLSKSNVKYIRDNALSQTKTSEILLSDKIEVMETGCFMSARVEEFTFPPKVTQINQVLSSNYGDNTYIKKINFSGNPTIFNSYAFYRLTNVTIFKVPSSITSMGAYALRIGSTTNKATIIMESATPCSITTSTFQATWLNKIIVPKGTSATYKSATNWSSFADYIFESNNIQINVDSSLVNNESVTYSIDNKPFEQFTSNTISLENVSTLVVKSTDANTTILIGTTQGSSDVGMITNTTSDVYAFESDTNVYITVQ